MSPEANRSVPPLEYHKVYQLKKDFPDHDFTINGGFKTFDQIKDALLPERKLKGVMIGRAAYQNSWLFADVDRVFYKRKNLGFSKKEVLYRYADFVDWWTDHRLTPMKVPKLAQPILHLFSGERHSHIFKRCLSDTEVYRDTFKNNFRDSLYNAIEVFEKLNPEALNKRPPDDDPRIITA